MYKFVELLLTNKPSRKFSIEIALMRKFASRGRFLRKLFQRRIYYVYGCDISQSANIHESVSFVHPLGIVIGSKATIEEGCYIYQHVTIGSDFMDGNAMPKIKRNTMVGAGAKIIGGITVGENCLVGANAVVTKNIPDNSVVFGCNQIKRRQQESSNR